MKEKAATLHRGRIWPSTIGFVAAVSTLSFMVFPIVPEWALKGTLVVDVALLPGILLSSSVVGGIHAFSLTLASVMNGFFYYIVSALAMRAYAAVKSRLS